MSETGTATFKVEQVCSGFEKEIINGATVAIFKTETDIENKNFFFMEKTQGEGDARFDDLPPATYYYVVTGRINAGNCNNVIRKEQGTIKVDGGDISNIYVVLRQ